MELFNSQYKPLKKRYLRGNIGKLRNRELHPMIWTKWNTVSLHINKINIKTKTTTRNGKGTIKKPQKKYQRGYDLDEYYESVESESSIWGTIMLLLIIALLLDL